MSTRIGTERAQATAWGKLYHWVHTLDEALDHDPVEQLQTSAQHLNQKVSHLEAVVRRLEAQTKSQKGGGK